MVLVQVQKWGEPRWGPNVSAVNVQHQAPTQHDVREVREEALLFSLSLSLLSLETKSSTDE